MDDNKEKDELNGLDPVPQDEPAIEPDDSAEEQIQQEIDNSATDEPTQEQNGDGEADEAAPDGIMITEELADGEAEDDDMCILCAEKPADKSFGENYDLCADCRNKLIKTPVRFSGLLSLVLVIFLGACGFSIAFSQINTLQGIMDGDDRVAENKLYSAISSYSEAGNIGWKTAKKLIRAYNQSGYLSGINNSVSTYFYDNSATENNKKLTFADKVGKSNLNAPWNKSTKKIQTDYTTAMAAYQKYYAYISEYDEKLYYGEMQAKDVPYDTLIKKLEEAKKADTSKEGTAFINYCEYYLASKCEKGYKTQLAYLKAIEKAAPDFEWLYLTTLTDLTVQNGDYTAALKYADKLERMNADDQYGEYFRAQILRRKGDYKGALEKMKPIIADYESNGFYYAYYEAAADCFLLKDYKQAREYLEVCYTDQAYLNYNSANFYALCCKMLKDNTGYTGVVNMLEENGMKISTTIDQFLNGKITAEQIFNEGEVDFE